MGPEPDSRLPASAWLAALRLTALVIGGAIVFSVLVSALILGAFANGIGGINLTISVVMPIIIGTPVMFYLAVNRQRLKLANAQLVSLAAIDWLTDCLNRRAFTRAVADALGKAAVTPGYQGALLMLDADRFKAVNDRFGHEHGDSALQLIAMAIKSAVREGDLVGRMGGEEFAIFLPQTDAAAAAQTADDIRAAVAGRVFAPNGQVHPLSVSIGGVSFAGSANLADLFRLADARLYEVKETQRGRVKLVTIPLRSAAPADAALRSDGAAN